MGVADKPQGICLCFTRITSVYYSPRSNNTKFSSCVSNTAWAFNGSLIACSAAIRSGSWMRKHCSKQIGFDIDFNTVTNLELGWLLNKFLCGNNVLNKKLWLVIFSRYSRE